MSRRDEIVITPFPVRGSRTFSDGRMNRYTYRIPPSKIWMYRTTHEATLSKYLNTLQKRC
jgi:hypothetical protein